MYVFFCSRVVMMRKYEINYCWGLIVQTDYIAEVTSSSCISSCRLLEFGGVCRIASIFHLPDCHSYMSCVDSAYNQHAILFKLPFCLCRRP
uniref:Uncharacterized protein n=1 Tax=Oryza brachyantha TaxID=4533 RepID=J3MRG1_ORYBR